jgi:hypothetical protein
MFVKAYNETREHGGINGLTPSEMFLQRLIKSDIYTKKKQESVTHVGKQNFRTQFVLHFTIISQLSAVAIN